MATEERLIDLEARIAHQDHSLNELSDEVFRQRKQLGHLEATCKYLLERFRTLNEPTTDGDPGAEQPPHY
jgi:SlyX protein